MATKGVNPFAKFEKSKMPKKAVEAKGKSKESSKKYAKGGGIESKGKTKGRMC